MCGIVGFVGGATSNMVDFFKWALVCDQIRGTHGTGVFTANSLGKVTYKKRAANAMDYISEAGIMPTTGSKFAVGHNRYATMGAHTDANSHPFNEGHIIGVHNGTLSDSGRSLAIKGEVRAVDSNYIFCALSRTTNPVEVLEKISGAFALVWRDSRTQRIYFARNSERPLAIKHNTIGDFVFASEGEMIDWLTAGTDRTRTRFAGDLVSLPVGEIWSFDYMARNPWATKEVTAFTPKPKQVTHYGYSGYGGRYGSGGTNHKRSTTRKSGSVTQFPSYDYTHVGEECIIYVTSVEVMASAPSRCVVRGDVVWPTALAGDDAIIYNVEKDTFRVHDPVSFTISSVTRRTEGNEVVAKYNSAFPVETSTKKN